MTTYQIKSVKINEEFTGELADAIARAIEINAEYQPSFGVQVESEDGETLWDSEESEEVSNTSDRNKVTVINIAHEVSDEAVERVRQLVDNVLSRNPNWSGAEIEIERDDFTWVDCSDEQDGSMLLASVARAIDGECN